MREMIQQRKGESDYDYGRRVGFDDYILLWWQLQQYPPEFQRGYAEGKAEIDRLIDNAAQSRAFG